MLNALIGTVHTHEWLATSTNPQVLHVFERVCNLLNERGELLSLVTPAVGAGPFALVLERPLNFQQWVTAETTALLTAETLALGPLVIQTNNATLWNPQPEWPLLTALDWPITLEQLKLTLAQREHLVINIDDFPNITAVAQHLAGRGIGLTPAGDDFLLGMIYALWAFLPSAETQAIAQHITTQATPRTTTLSAAWLQAAARGEAAVSWHNWFSALSHTNQTAITSSLSAILQTGHTSGADALSGFLTTATALLSEYPAAEFWQINN